MEGTPPGDALPPPPQRATPARKGARCGAGAGSTRPHRPHPGHTGRRTLAARSGGRAAGGGTAPDTRRPSQRWKAPPPGTPFRHPHSEQCRPARAHAVGPVLGPHARIDRTRDTRVAEPWLHAPEDERPGEGQRRHQAPLTTVEGTPPGDALPPPPQRATPARKGARCGAGAGSTRPHRPRQGHAGRGTLAARSGGRAAGGGTAPDTRRPSQRWKAPPPGTPFRHPHSEQRRPARAHAVGPVLGPHARIDRTRDTRVAEPWLHAPEDERPGEGQRLTPGAPHNGGRHPPRGRPLPPPQRATPARKAARCGAGPGSTRPHRPHPGHTGAEPWLHALEDERPGKGQRLTPGAPHNGGRHPPGDALPPPPQRAASARKGASCGAGAGSTRPHRPRPGHAGRGTLAARSGGRAAGEGTAPDTRRPSQRWKAPPPGTPIHHPHSEQRRPARAHAMGPVLGPHARIDRTRDTRVAEPWLHAEEDERPREGQRLTPGATNNGGRHPPPGTPFRHPHSEQRRPARAHALGPVLGPHARIDRTRDTRVAEPWLHAPEDERPGKGQRLTPGAPHNGGRHPPRGRPSATPTASSVGPQRRTLWGRCWVHTPASTAPGTLGSRDPG